MAARVTSGPLPALVTVAAADYAPRYAHVARVMAVFGEPTLPSGRRPIWAWRWTRYPPRRRERRCAGRRRRRARVLGERITGTPEEQAKSLVGKLRARGLL